MRGGESALAVRPDGDALQKVAAVRADVVALLREKRYEEALAALYRARSESPGDPELQRSIDQLKEFLVGAYAKRLGGLDQIAKPIPLSAVRSPDAVLLARYIDGTSTFGDLAQMCPLGQLRTLQVLIGLYSGTEPPRIYSVEVARVTPDPPTTAPPASWAPTAGAPTSGPPNSGLRAHEADAGATPEERPPDTARSGSVPIGAPPVETEE